MIAYYLSKQQELDADQKAIQQANFNENLKQKEIQQCFSLMKKRKKPFQIFHKEMREYWKFILL